MKDPIGQDLETSHLLSKKKPWVFFGERCAISFLPVFSNRVKLKQVTS